MRRLTLSVCLLLSSALPCYAQGEKPKPNTLSAKEIADGWILLFDGETTFGWKLDAPSEKEKPVVKEGVLDMSTAFPRVQSAMESLAAFPACELQFEYKSEDDDRVIVGFNFHPDERKYLKKSLDWTEMSIKLTERHLAYAKKKHSHVLFLQHPRAKLNLRNIKLRPLNTKSLFTSKDLTGWKEFAGKKSKFTVTEKGEISVKDGPGDLQTVGKYKDFVLQLDCISNGKHLNSGIFFRCKDGEYQNGYEAQIFNKFAKEPTQKYLVEEYDPKSNKLLAKKEVLSTAFDYGTGAIYRRVPARKEMAKDHEWFGMTIVAHGNHIATWVNGVQVVDWTDNRPKSDNPRNGCRLEAGHISIQGHDPTTDLSFKNIRIAELK